MKIKQIDPDTNKRSLATITQQLNKKTLSKKSKKSSDSLDNERSSEADSLDSDLPATSHS